MASKKSSTDTNQAESTPQPEEPTSQAKPPAQESKVVETEWTGQSKPRTDGTPPETGDAQPDDTPPSGKTFTQEELDSLIANRLKREKAEQERLEKERDKLAQQVEAYEEAQKTEEEKRLERLQALEEENQRLADERKQTIIQMDLTRASVAAGFDPEAAIRLVDENELEFDDDGRLSNAAEVVEQLTEKWPGLVKANNRPPAAPSVNSSRSQQSSRPSEDELRARYFGSGGGSFWSSGGVSMPIADE